MSALAGYRQNGDITNIAGDIPHGLVGGIGKSSPVSQRHKTDALFAYETTTAPGVILFGSLLRFNDLLDQIGRLPIIDGEF
ncbi:hypothetical protein M798_13965 [Brucella melitensis ADMAS-G1]|nr:hypothetical protein M798_13965 [Brucella melitensis ADMAS-G1]